MLDGYDIVLKQFLVDRFRYGFRVNFVGERLAVESPNLQSALERPEITSAKLRKECEAGRIVGPFSTPPFPNFRCSPLGIVPTKVVSVGDATKLLKFLGNGCFMAKTDIKSAFRIIPIHPADYSLLGMKWNKMYYFDRCLAMGLSSSCAIFESFSTALEWLAINYLGACAVLHILDDFLFIAKSKDQCEHDLENFIKMCNYLGVPLAPEKTVGPANVLQFAGITLDSVRQEARLPEEKLRKCRGMLQDFHVRRSVCLRELQSLIGLLNFTCLVVVRSWSSFSSSHDRSYQRR